MKFETAIDILVDWLFTWSVLMIGYMIAAAVVEAFG